MRSYRLSRRHDASGDQSTNDLLDTGASTNVGEDLSDGKGPLGNTRNLSVIFPEINLWCELHS